MVRKKRVARYQFNLSLERIKKEYLLGNTKLAIYEGLKDDGLFDYSYVSFTSYFKEIFQNSPIGKSPKEVIANGTKKLTEFQQKELKIKQDEQDIEDKYI